MLPRTEGNIRRPAEAMVMFWEMRNCLGWGVVRLSWVRYILGSGREGGGDVDGDVEIEGYVRRGE